MNGNIVVTDNAVIVGTTMGTFALDPDTLEPLWSLPVSGDLAIGNSLLLISTPSELFAYAVPEPGTLGLSIMAVLGWLTARRTLRTRLARH